MKKVALFQEENDSSNYTIKRFKQEAESLGVDFSAIKYSDLSFSFDTDSGFVCMWGEVNVLDYFDCFIFRSAKNSEVNNSFAHYSYMMQYAIGLRKKRSINYWNFVKHYKKYSKMYNYAVLASHGISIIPTYVFSDVKQLLSNQSKNVQLQFPLIAKMASSSQGKGTYKINDNEKLTQFVQKIQEIDKFVIQKYMSNLHNENNFELRVLVVGGKIIAAMKRNIGFSDTGRIVFESADSYENIFTNQEISNIVLRSAELLDLDYAGVDVMVLDNKPYIIELNAAAVFKRLEEVSGENVARAILEYLVKNDEV